MVLDNSGCYSHGGQRIEQFNDGSASITYYSDIVNDRSRSKALYELRDDVLYLRTGSWRSRTLYRVSFQGANYWVYSNEVDEAISPAGEGVRRMALKEIAKQDDAWVPSTAP